MTAPHPAVRHPHASLPAARPAVTKANDKVLTWLTDHVLASVLMFDCALILPLLVAPMGTAPKVTLALFSGSWIQWWALPALQRSQNKADAKRDAKADADHAALTHIAHSADRAEKAIAALSARQDVLADSVANLADATRAVLAASLPRAGRPGGAPEENN